MKRVTATEAKQNFGRLLEEVLRGARVAIERHGRVVAVLVAPGVIEGAATAPPSPMRHRHLEGRRLGAAQMDDIVERGSMPAWQALLKAVRADRSGALAAKLRRVCAARVALPAAEAAGQDAARFFLNWLDRHGLEGEEETLR